MKKYNDFSEDNAFFELKNEITGLPEPKTAMTVEEEAFDGSGQERSVRIFSLTVMMLVAVAAVMCILIFLIAGRESPRESPSETLGGSEEWRGAFLDRTVYDECVEASVSVRDGRYATEREWSGFVLSQDGWIATCTDSVGKGDRGRIYVTLSGGEEYPVESLISYGELALLKISASLPSAVTLREGAAQDGEKLVGVINGSDLASGEISNARTGKINISFEEGGTPLFDREGRLVGMTCYREDGAYALSAEQIKGLLLKAKEK